MKAIIQHIAIRLREPCMFWGGFGVGKTQGAKQASDAENALLCDIRVSQYEGVDFRGIPSVEQGKTTWNLPATMPFVGNDKFPDDRLILLMFDEINSAIDDGVLAVCYQIINEWRCGEHVLKPNVRIIAAGNRETDRGVTRRMPMPLNNRFTHAEVVPDAEATAYYFQSIGIARPCLGFLLFRKNLISTFDPARADKAVATPRTWEKAFRYWMDPLLPESVRAAAISGAVGEGPAAEFLAYTQLMGRVVTTKQIMADPRGTPLPENDGMCWATCMHISGDLSKRTAGPLGVYLDRIASDKRFGPEYQITAWQMALNRDGSLDETPEFMSVARLQQAVFAGR
jgi:hypothetical protein